MDFPSSSKATRSPAEDRAQRDRRSRRARLGWRYPVRVGLIAGILGLGMLGARPMLDPLVRSMIYPAPPVRVPSPPPEPLEAVHLELGDGETGGGVVAWCLEAQEPTSPLVLFFHGNGENLETMRMAGTFEAFHELGVAVLAVDYPGYGNSPGTPSEPAVHASADAALAWVREHSEKRPVVAAGWSLGAAVAIALAARSEGRLDGLIALSPWTSLPDVARNVFPGPVVRFALSERYDSLALAPDLELPTLLVHGQQDSIIPIDQGRRLADAWGGFAKWVEIRDAGHNDLLVHSEVWEALGWFLRQVEDAG
jgi:pimeloyl-ACP methyl ester carboxylesterase